MHKFQAKRGRMAEGLLNLMEPGKTVMHVVATFKFHVQI